jgi:glycosyltransferase involved in cell wall biosynthesis
MPGPFFTIGVTTYARPELLRQTLRSVLEQTFADFEVIVGNDYPEPLTAADLGISDGRVRIINHPHNLGEVANMNSLLAQASGRYFTWLADDDLLRPNHLQVVHDLVLRNDHPDALFPGYALFFGASMPEMQPAAVPPVTRLTGRQLLERYFRGRLKIISVYGVFEVGRLRSIVGGVEELCAGGVALYAEYLFVVKCGLFDRIVHVDSPLVLSRAHPASWSVTNVELERYGTAGRELLRRSADVMAHPALSRDRGRHLVTLCAMHMSWFSTRAASAQISAGNGGAKAMARAIGEFRKEAAHMRGVLEEYVDVTSPRWRWTLAAARLRGARYIVEMILMSGIRRTVRRFAPAKS